MTTENNLNENQDRNSKMEDNITSHEYDGIKELNNPPPYWITLIFLVTIAFSMFYVIHFFGYPNNKKDQISIYEQKVADFELKKAEMQQEASGGIVMNDAEILAEGEKLYTEKGCMACHGLKGEGNNIGPNLTDNFWINGCSSEDIVKIITEGKPMKGMTPYKNMMTEKQISHLTAYIKTSLVGSNPANAKSAQGEECQ
jgi:cytochrome c oxidase cbb3-type subunit 3